jgi:hypothetical protein
MDGYSVFLKRVENGERESTRQQAVVSSEGLFVNAGVKPKRFDVSVRLVKK